MTGQRALLRRYELARTAEHEVNVQSEAARHALGESPLPFGRTWKAARAAGTVVTWITRTKEKAKPTQR